MCFNKAFNNKKKCIQQWNLVVRLIVYFWSIGVWYENADTIFFVVIAYIYNGKNGKFQLGVSEQKCKFFLSSWIL